MQNDRIVRMAQLRKQLATLLESGIHLSDPQIVEVSTELDRLVIDEMKKLKLVQQCIQLYVSSKA